MLTLDLLLTALASALALALRPWRAVGPVGPPWPWLVWCAVMPLFWSADHLVHVPLIQPLSGACLLVLLAGWPLAVLAMLGVAALSAWLGQMGWETALSRLVWQGLLPGTLAMGLGLAIRRWLPPQPFIYILGRAFLVSALSLALTGWAHLALTGTPPGQETTDVMIGRWLSAWGDAFLTGMFAAIFVALRPEWLATWSDRLYLPPRPPGPPPT